MTCPKHDNADHHYTHINVVYTPLVGGGGRHGDGGGDGCDWCGAGGRGGGGGLGGAKITFKRKIGHSQFFLYSSTGKRPKFPEFPN